MSQITSLPASLRPGVSADAAALAALGARTFRDTYGPPFGASDPADVEAYVQAHFAPALQAAELADPGLCTLVAEAGGALVGYAQVRVGSDPTAAVGFAAVPDAPGAALLAGATAELARLYVDRAFHGAGLGAALFDAARRVAGDRGARALWLDVYQENARAVAFYRRQGARVAAEATFRMGDEVQRDWVLVVPTTRADA